MKLSPAGTSFKEKEVLLGFSLDESDASVALPMTHRLQNALLHSFFSSQIHHIQNFPKSTTVHKAQENIDQSNKLGLFEKNERLQDGPKGFT